MRNLALTFAALPLLACGSPTLDGAPDARLNIPDAKLLGPSDVGVSLEGTWVNVLSATNTLALSFTGNTFKDEGFIGLTDGTWGIQIATGTFTVAGSTLTLTTSASSCQGVRAVSKAKAVTFARTGNTLQLTNGDTVLSFQLASEPAAGIAKIGCLDTTNASFVANPVGTVP